MKKPTIFIDADACPVKAEAEQIITRHQLDLVIVSNGGIRPSSVRKKRGGRFGVLILLSKHTSLPTL